MTLIVIFDNINLVQKKINIKKGEKMNQNQTKRNTIIISSIIILCIGICVFWPCVSRLIGIIHYNITPGLNKETIKLELSQVYEILQAFIAVLSIPLAFCTYYLGRSKERDDQFRKILTNELEHIFTAINEWGKLQNALTSIEEKLTGSEIIKNISDKYREKELFLLTSMFNNNQTDSKLKFQELDDAFLDDFRKANIKQLSDVLFNILDWSWAVIQCLEKVYGKDTGRLKELDKYRETIIEIIRDYIGPHSQFVFGKYRHIMWKLDKGKSPFYRGEKYADRLFIYERTIADIIPTSSKLAFLQLADMKERNKKLGLDQKLQEELNTLFINKWNQILNK